MALGISGNGSGGQAVPYVKFDARAGRMFRVDRVQGADGVWISDPVDITQNGSFVFDMENIEVGWINFSGDFPVRSMVILGKAPIPERPDGNDKNGKPAFKQGFNLRVALPKNLNGGTAEAREFSSTAGCVIEAVDQLHDNYTSAPESKTGKLPVARIVETIPVKSGQSTNYKPVFQIESWVDRPPSLTAGTDTTAAPQTNGVQQRQTAPATGSTMKEPPRQAVQPAASSDFG